MGIPIIALQHEAHPSFIWQKCVMTPLSHSKTFFLAHLQCGNEDQGEIHPFPSRGNMRSDRELEAFSAFLRYGLQNCATGHHSKHKELEEYSLVQWL